MLCFIVFLDSLGPFLMLANSAYLYTPALPTTTQDEFDAGRAIFWKLGEDLTTTPIKYGAVCQFSKHIGYDCAKGTGDVQAALAWTMQIGTALTMLCTGLAGALSGPLTKRIGKKSALLIYTWGGGVFFILAGMSKNWGSMYLYWLFRALMGTFAGCAPVCGSIIADIWSDADAATRQGKQMGIMIGVVSAVGFGPLIGLAMTSDLFMPLYVGGVLEFFAGLLVLIIPTVEKPPPSESPPETEPTDKKTDEPTPAPAKKEYIKWVMVLWAARLFDRLGGGHIQYMTATKMGEGGKWAPLKNPQAIGQIMIGLFFMLILTITVALPNFGKRLGMALTGFVGQFMAAIGFFILCSAGLAVGYYLYVVVIMFMMFFSTMAGFLVNPMLMMLVPKENFGHWLGYQTAFAQVTQAFAPFALLSFLQMEGDGDLFEGGFLCLNGIACFLSAAAYLVLLKKFPKPKTKVQPQESEAMRVFNETGDWKWLSSEEKREVNMKLLEDGKKPLTSEFGSFADDRNDVHRIKETAEKNFAFLSSSMTANIVKWQKSNDQEREEIRKRMRHFTQALVWTPEIERDVGSWFVEYMKQAGYMPWTSDPMLWKSMVMTAFPPILDHPLAEDQSFVDNPVPIWLKFDRMMRMYQKQAVEYSKDIQVKGRIASFVPAGLS